MYVVTNDMSKIYAHILHGSGLRSVVKENFDDKRNMWHIPFRSLLNE